MEADINVNSTPRNDSHGRNQRRLNDFIARHKIKMSRRDQLLAKAVAKRARKNAKRVRDAIRSELGQRLARELAFGEPFFSSGLVDAVITSPADAASHPSDDQFASWALNTGRDGLGGYASVAIDPDTGIRLTSRYLGAIKAHLPEYLAETPFRVMP